MDDRLLEIRRRLHDDFEYYSENALKIRTKAGEIAPLALNDAQRILHEAIEKQIKERGFVRVIILKGRQQGLSTYVGGRLYFTVSQNKARKAMVVTHHADSTRALFDMTQRYHDKCPDILKPSTKYSSRRELSFDKLDSSYVVATAGGDSVGRGETLTDLHASEVAFWQKSKAKEIWNGLEQAVPKTPGTAIFVESTANGVSGIFYDLWCGAVEGKNDYVPVFIPWFLSPEYREPVPEGFKRTPDEEDLVAQYGLDDEQLMFRRIKVAKNGVDLFKQEYPCCPQEAFLTTGRPVFNPDQLQRLLDAATAPIKLLAYTKADESFGTWEEHPRGELALYREISPTDQYYIGADTAMGVRGGDWSVATVLDSKKRHVATLRCQVHPDYFAEMLYSLGCLFNMANICPENNNHGILTCVRLSKDFNYPYVYTEVVVDKLTDKETIKIGFSTNVKSKPFIIDKLRAAFRENEIETQDRTTIQELLTYIVTETGNMEAEEGCHDDTVIALALANHIHEGAFKPIPNQSSYYVEMI